MSWHLQFFHVGFELVDKARDGSLTLEEVAETLSDHYPDQFNDVLEQVKKANEDEKYTVTEVIKIISAVVL